YSYNDPIHFTDPDGLDAVAAAVTAAGAAALADGPIPIGDVIAIGILIGVGIILLAKGGKQNIRDTRYRDTPTEELERRYRDPSTPKAEKRRIEKELKARGRRNIQKRREQYGRDHSRIPAGISIPQRKFEEVPQHEPQRAA
ncbi:MAG: hypothetical protein QW650_09360, partial [Thermofilum sp.]